MALTDYKVKDADFTAKDIASLSDRPSADGMGATALKERFDMGAKKVLAPKLNALIDLLNGSEGAANIGVTPIDGVAGYFLQEVLIALKLLLDDKKSIEQADKEIGAKFDAAEAQALVKEISFSEGSGVFTITKYDGSVQIIDTAIEKVALDVRLDGQQFVLTLADGSEQRVDLSAFITQTEVKSSDTITLAIENGAIVARITSGSVMLSHLNAEVTAYIDAKEAAAANSAAAAKLSEQNALNSANTAKASEQAAKACQEQACSCATQAELSRQAAATSKSNAEASEQAAKKAQEEAEKAAGEAKAIAGGDFLETSVYDPHGKETDVFKYVDDAIMEKFGEEGKLPVQNGGLYINSETTEEDKAEAQEALKEIGMFGYAEKDVNIDNISITFDTALTNGIYGVGIKAENRLDSDPPMVVGYNLYGTVLNLLNNGSTIQQNGWVIQIFFPSANMSSNAKDFYIRKKVNYADWTEWREFSNNSKFLPLDGSVPMSGELYFYNKLGRIVVNNSTLQLELRKEVGDTSNRRFLNINQMGDNELQKALSFSEIVDGKQTKYNIFGEHNVTKGTTDLTAGTSALGNSCIHLVYE